MVADVYSAIYGDSDFWDGTTAWGYDATSDIHSPTEHADQSARDAQYTAAYTSIAAWESARDGVANGADTEYGIVQTQWDADESATALQITGWTNAPTIVIRAIGAARHSGVWDDGADSPYRLVGDATFSLLRLRESDLTVDGLQFHNTETVDATNGTIVVQDAITGINISNCIIKQANGQGIRINNATITIDIWNNVIYDTSATADCIWVDNCSTCTIYNNTIEGATEGIDIDAVGTSCIIKNNIIFNNTDDISDAVGVTIDYNGSDDGDGTNDQQASGGDWANEMSNYATNDYTLDSAGNMYDNGTDDPGSGLFSDDIAGTIRTSTWSIGAFEFDVAVAAGGILISLNHRKIMKNLLTR